MEINRAAIKANAKGQMRVAQPHAVVVAIVYYLIVLVAEGVSVGLTGVMGAGFDNLLNGYAYYNWSSVGIAAYFILIVVSLMLSIVQIGFQIYCLRVSRLQPAGFGNLFDGFSRFFKFLGLMIVQGIFIYLWTLLFIIPGIIAALRYSMAVYIMIDNPDMSIMDCIRASKEMMRGRKGELFVLELSFFGWILLSVVPFVLFWTMPYMEVTMANYYNALLGLRNNGGGYGGPGGGQYGSRQYDQNQQNNQQGQGWPPPPSGGGQDHQESKDGWKDGKPPWEL